MALSVNRVYQHYNHPGRELRVKTQLRDYPKFLKFFLLVKSKRVTPNPPHKMHLEPGGSSQPGSQIGGGTARAYVNFSTGIARFDQWLGLVGNYIGNYISQDNHLRF